jgi:TRAP-type C4-dicarboxylate transport system substrate-binding protein
MSARGIAAYSTSALWRSVAQAANVQRGAAGSFSLLPAQREAVAISCNKKRSKGGKSMRALSAILVGAAAALMATATAQAQVTLKASHQFPGGKHDVRDDMVQLIAKEAKEANVGLNVQVYPGASLFKAKEQWNAMVNGQLDISLFPLDYASGKVPSFSATLMPGLIRNQERAKRVNDSQFMKDIRADIEKHGVIVLSDAWFAGGVASKDKCILRPDDLKGLKIRAAGPTFAAMWQAAGASVVSPPSNEIYNAFQTGVINATDTSLGSFGSMRLYEVSGCLTAPGDNALWFMYEPVLMSKKSFDRLNKKQQAAIIKAGKDAQAFYQNKADAMNEDTIKQFKDHKVKVVTMNDADYQAWIDMAKKSAYDKFAKNVPNGKKLIDEALAVK